MKPLSCLKHQSILFSQSITILKDFTRLRVIGRKTINLKIHWCQYNLWLYTLNCQQLWTQIGYCNCHMSPIIDGILITPWQYLNWNLTIHQAMAGIHWWFWMLYQTRSVESREKLLNVAWELTSCVLHVRFILTKKINSNI